MPPIDPRNIEVVDPSQAKLFRNKTMAERVEMINDANQTARHLIAAGARSLHSEWSEEQVQNEVVRRMTRAATRSTTTGM